MAKEYISYSQKLLDPRWQKARLVVLERDNWTCQECFATDKTLHVHHLAYERNVEPWEYPDNQLVTLCEDCHSNVKVYRPKLEEDIISTLRYRLKDRFLLHCFSEFINFNMFLPEMTQLLWEADQVKLMEFLQSHVEERNKGGPQLESSADMPKCNACGSKKIIDFKKYHYLKCSVCGFSINYGTNPNDKTEAC